MDSSLILCGVVVLQAEPTKFGNDDDDDDDDDGSGDSRFPQSLES
jgi:hypothetical protein